MAMMRQSFRGVLLYITRNKRRWFGIVSIKFSLLHSLNSVFFILNLCPRVVSENARNKFD